MGKKAEFPLALVIKAVDEATAPLRAVNKQIADMTAPVRKLNNSFHALAKEAGLSGVVDAFKGVGTAARKVGSEAWALGKKFALMAAGAGYGLYKILKGSIDAGDKLSEMAQRTGLSVDAYAQLQFAAAQADVEQEKFNGAMDTFNVNLGAAKAGTGKMLKFLMRVSPVLAGQVKHAKNNEEAIGLMTKAFELVEDPAKRAKLAAAAFGDPQFGQFLGQGTKAIDAQRKKFFELAGSQQKFADESSKVDNAIRESETAFEGLKNAAIVELYPAITALSTAVTKFVTDNREGIRQWAEETGAAIKTWVDEGGLKRLEKSLRDVAAGVGEVIKWLGGLKGAAIAVALVLSADLITSLLNLGLTLGKLSFKIIAFIANTTGFTGWAIGWIQYLWMMRASILAGLVPSLGAAAASMWAFTVALLANPITWVVAGVVALAGAAYLIYKNWEPIKAFFESLWESMKHPLEALKTAKEFWGKTLGLTHTVENAPSFSSAADAARPNAPAMSSGGETKLSVDFSNIPKGARVTKETNSSQPIDMSLGYSSAGG